MTMTASLLKDLQKGRKITASTITKVYGIQNPGRHIHYLRNMGINIVSKPLTRTINKRRHAIVEYSIQPVKP